MYRVNIKLNNETTNTTLTDVSFQGKTVQQVVDAVDCARFQESFVRLTAEPTLAHPMVEIISPEHLTDAVTNNRTISSFILAGELYTVVITPGVEEVKTIPESPWTTITKSWWRVGIADKNRGDHVVLHENALWYHMFGKFYFKTSEIK